MHERVNQIPRRGRPFRRAPRPRLVGLTVAVAAAFAALVAGAGAGVASTPARCEPMAVPANCSGRIGGEPDTAIALPGFGVAAGFRHASPCDTVAGWSRSRREDLHGRTITYYYVWAHDPFHRTFSATLVCGHAQEVWGLTSGPGGDGESLPCPRASRPVEDGAGWDVNPSGRGFSQNRGGFGQHHDGYWHYRFYNPEHGTVHAKMYALCRAA